VVCCSVLWFFLFSFDEFGVFFSSFLMSLEYFSSLLMNLECCLCVACGLCVACVLPVLLSSSSFLFTNFVQKGFGGPGGPSSGPAVGLAGPSAGMFFSLVVFFVCVLCLFNCHPIFRMRVVV